MSKRILAVIALSTMAIVIGGVAAAQQSKFQDSQKIIRDRRPVVVPRPSQAKPAPSADAREEFTAPLPALGPVGVAEACAKACSDCQLTCSTCAAHCAKKVPNDRQDHFTSMQLCQDCADICSVAARIVARGGPLSGAICQSCAEACDACARECDKFQDDPMLQKCAHECRQCAITCRAMVDGAGEAKS